MDQLAIGAAWLAQENARSAASDVLYVRAASSATVRAKFGQRAIEVDDGNGIFTRIESWDFIILRSELLLDDVPITPSVGDKILFGDQGTAVVYEVISPAGLPASQWSDHLQLAYRIHTKYAGTQPAFQS